MAGEIQEIKLADTEISELNNRKNLDAGTEESSLNDLAKSIKEDGGSQPGSRQRKGVNTS